MFSGILFALVTTLTLCFFFSVRGHAFARTFLWVWAGFAFLASDYSPFPSAIRTNVIGSSIIFLFYGFILYGERQRKALEKSQGEVRMLLSASNQRTEDEILRISRHLHDEVNAKILIAKRELRALEQLINPTAFSEIAKSIQHIEEQLTDTYNDCRDIIKSSRVEVIDTIGLVGALDSLIHSHTSLSGITFRFDHSITHEPHKNVAINVYRIIQESIHNAIKHASPTRIEVLLSESNGKYSVSIKDNGTGMKKQKSDGVGLIDIRERTQLIGGELNISSSKTGTTIEFNFTDKRP